MQPVPGLDPQPPARERGRRVIGVHVTSGSGVRVVIGLFIIGWGLLRLAANQGWDVAYDVLDRWYFPAALTAFGLWRLLVAGEGSGRAVGGLLAGVGGWWLISETYHFRFDVWDWWPVAIIVVGLMVIARAWRSDGPPAPPGATTSGAAWSAPAGVDAAATPSPPTSVTDGGPVSGFAFWSGVRRRVSAGFRRADLTAFMGSIELDLRPAIMMGDQAVVDVFVLMGGIEIKVPPDWSVANEAVVIMAGVDDRSTGASGSSRTLVVRGVVLMGAVDIRS